MHPVFEMKETDFHLKQLVQFRQKIEIMNSFIYEITTPILDTFKLYD